MLGYATNLSTMSIWKGINGFILRYQYIARNAVSRLVLETFFNYMYHLIAAHTFQWYFSV